VAGVVRPGCCCCFGRFCVVRWLQSAAAC
jgi:hypothetical protein